MTVPKVEITAVPGRLDAVLARAAGISRGDVQRAIGSGRVLVDGAPRTKAFRLSGGERIVADLPASGEVQAEPGGVPIAYEDEHLLVVAKPAGMVTHPTASRRTGTLVNRLIGMGTTLSAGSAPDRPGIVHRLDAGTSGLLVVAKDDATHRALSEMLARRLVEREYVALVRGDVAHEEFSVEAPLGRRGSKVVVRRGAGATAETHFEVLERLPRSTLLRARPRTGRTHQIRVHLAAVGHPILGDRSYGGGGDDARALGLSRPFLHARLLAFDHPSGRGRVEAEEPLPEDLAAALDRARTA